MLHQQLVDAVNMNDMDTVRAILTTHYDNLRKVITAQLNKLVREGPSPLLDVFEQILGVDEVLYTAVKAGITTTVHDILSRHPLLHQETLNAMLNTAVIYNHLHIIQDLLSYGANDIERASFKAASRGASTVLEWLLQHYSSDNIQSLLSGAIAGGNIPTVEVALKHGAAITDRSVLITNMNSQSVKVGVYFVLNYDLTPEQIRMVICAVNKWRDAESALTLIHHGFATTADFSTITFTPEQIRELILNGIVDFPGYEDVAGDVRHRLSRETELIGEYLPSVLRNLSLGY